MVRKKVCASGWFYGKAPVRKSSHEYNYYPVHLYSLRAHDILPAATSVYKLMSLLKETQLLRAHHGQTLYVVYTSTERSGFNLREGDYSNHFVPEDWGPEMIWQVGFRCKLDSIPDFPWCLTFIQHSGCMLSSQSCLSLRTFGLQPARLLCLWILQSRTLGGLPCPSPGGLPALGIAPMSLAAPALQAESLPLTPCGSPWRLG